MQTKITSTVTWLTRTINNPNRAVQSRNYKMLVPVFTITTATRSSAITDKSARRCISVEMLSNCCMNTANRSRVSLKSIFSERTTLRSLYAISRPSVVCCLSSVCLSVTLVHPTQAVELFGNLFSPYDSPGTLLFWCQKSLVGDAPFPLKSAFKVTHPL